ncbi:MAG TPA: GNAT family N-acetyltransferase [Candidatus Tumulicola sp.]|jgi:predicted acetyltransferase
MRLVAPSMEYLPSYVSALERGWSPDNLRPEVANEELDAIRRSAEGFLRTLDDRAAAGAPIRLPDGSSVPRLPGFRRWLWDGEVCGSIGLRWSPGTPALPETCLGHIGYGVVPWKRRRGYAAAALAQILPEARDIGLPYVELTTEPDNVASQGAILANGGVLVERFIAPYAHGGEELLRFRITL